MQIHKRLIASGVGAFGLIGILNTLGDITIFNILRVFTETSSEQTTRIILLNIISAGTMTVVSFFLNRRYVFRSSVKASRIVPFFAVSLSSIFIVQSIVITLSTPLIRPLAEWFTSSVLSSNSLDFVLTNTVKVLATSVSMIYNYTLYKKVVFKQPPS